MIKNKILLQYQFYPNPNQGEGVTINLLGMEGDVNISLMDATGRLLEKTTWNVEEYAQREWRFNQTLSSGLYEVRIQQGSRQETQRMLVVRQVHLIQVKEKPLSRDRGFLLSKIGTKGVFYFLLFRYIFEYIIKVPKR